MPVTLPTRNTNSVAKSRGRGSFHIHNRDWAEEEEFVLIRNYDYELKATNTKVLSKQSWIHIESKLKQKFPDKFITADECKHRISQLGERFIKDTLKVVNKPRAETAFGKLISF